jgi:hypothetical protein
MPESSVPVSWAVMVLVSGAPSMRSVWVMSNTERMGKRVTCFATSSPFSSSSVILLVVAEDPDLGQDQ